MKNIFKSIALLFLVFNCLEVKAQTQAEQLVGTWVFDYNQSISKIDEQTQKDYTLMPAVIKSQLEQSYKGRKLIFNANGSFIQQIADGKQMLGTWVRDNNQNITITSPQGDGMVFKIENLSRAIMVLKLQKKGNERIILSQWYLNKN